MSEHRISRLHDIPENFSYVDREDMTFLITYSEYRWLESGKKNIFDRRKRLEGGPSEAVSEELKEAAAVCRKAGLDFRTWEEDRCLRSYHSETYAADVRENLHTSGMMVEIKKDTPDAALHALFDYAVIKRTGEFRKAGEEWYGRFSGSRAISSIAEEVHTAALRELVFAHEKGRSSTLVTAEFREDGVTVRGSLGEPKRLDYASLGYRNMDEAKTGALIAVVTDGLRGLLLKDPRVFDVTVQLNTDVHGLNDPAVESRFRIVLSRTGTR